MASCLHIHRNAIYTDNRHTARILDPHIGKFDRQSKVLIVGIVQGLVLGAVGNRVQFPFHNNGFNLANENL